MMQVYKKSKELDKQIDDKIKNYMVNEEFDPELIKLAEIALEHLKNNGELNDKNDI